MNSAAVIAWSVVLGYFGMIIWRITPAVWGLIGSYADLWRARIRLFRVCVMYAKFLENNSGK